MKIKFEGPVPRCFSRRQYELWKSVARGWRDVVSPCTDCTPGFQAAMKVAGKCEHPEMVFDEDEDGFAYGRMPRKGDKRD
jgi:hypothetical protein